MVLEIGRIHVQAGREDDFVAAYHQARELLETTDGCRSVRMTQGVEASTEFVLLVEWDSVEAHIGNFRNSDRFPRWRGLIAPFFDGDPMVAHWADV